MTPEQEQMFQLRNTVEPMVPGAQVGIVSAPETTELDVVNLGLAQTVQYMASNGPTRPIQRGRAKVMTKRQLEEQKMNEQAGLPSNLEEAYRVKNLEQRVSGLDAKLDLIVAALGQPVGQQQVTVVPPPTPLVRPAVEQPPLGQNPTSAVRNIQQQRALVPPMEPLIPPQLPPESPLVTSPLVSPPPASQVTVAPEIKVPPITLGPMGSQGGEDVDVDQFSITELGENEAAIPALVDEPAEPAIDPVEQKRLERQQILTDQVANWLKEKDCHKFWRQFLAGACNKNLSYNTWPPEYQTKFNERFSAIVSDPHILSSLCGRITHMQNGHLVAPHVAGAFVVVIAGMLSFALMEV